MSTRRQQHGTAARKAAPFDDSHGHSASLNELLISGGDARLALTFPSGENAYGCTPHPRTDVIDFASTTASSISEAAYRTVNDAYQALLADSLRLGADEACEAAVSRSRAALLTRLGLEKTGTAAVFSPSGTDTQLQTLFLLKLLSNESLATVAIGSDQTGSGAAYTWRGQHFSQTTSSGTNVARGDVIPGLAGVESFEVGFSKPTGEWRSSAEMDEAVLSAVQQAVSRHDLVVLQTMEASKFGWKAPSDACVDEAVRRWPGRVRVVADACQLRISRERVKWLLSKGQCVMVTGSKFFTGPPFCGALLLPAELAGIMRKVEAPPGALAGYTTRFDWPAEWQLRNAFPGRFNLGQWLRWEAALEEMRLYYEVPEGFRDQMQELFQEFVENEIEKARNIALLKAPRGTGSLLPTIFPLVLNHGGTPLSEEMCAIVYRAMRHDFSTCANFAEDAAALKPCCQIGQAVALPGGKAALRISLSARLTRECWSSDPHQTERNISRMRGDLSAVIRKLDCLALLAPDLPLPKA
jgi:hypothetical protein